MNEFANKVVSALDRALGVSPSNAGKAPKTTATNPAWDGPGQNNMAASINASVAPNPASPMDHPTVVKRRHDPLDNMPAPSFEVVALFGREAGYRAPKDLAKKLQELQAEWQRAHDGTVAHTPRAAIEAFQQHQANIMKAITAGETIDQHEGWEQADFEADFRQKLRAFKQHAQNISVAAYELVKPHTREYFDAVDALASRLEAEEIERYARFKMPYTPSAIVLAARRSARAVLEYSASFNTTSGLSPLGVAALFPL